MVARARIRKTRESEDVRLARRITTPEQVARDCFHIVDVANFTEADQRRSMRSKEVRTIRKLTRIEKLERAGIIDKEQARACEWYADAYHLGYSALGITANYDAASPSGNCVHTHLARHQDQQDARDDYRWARQAISPVLLGMFEFIVIHGRPLGKLRLQFRMAAAQLVTRVGHLIPLL